MNFIVDPAMSRTLRGPGGKACANCTQVKSKCIGRLDGNNCERCHRLNKTCVPSSPAKRRGPKRGTTSRANPASARLEKKLDDLVSLMKVQQVSVDPTRDSSIRGDSEHEDVISTKASQHDDEPSAEEANASLRRFRENMMPLCPYVYISPELDAATLCQQYPFLWLSIMSVASVSTKTRYSLGRRIKDTIVHKIVAGGERSVDMLLGVLTYLCWVHLFPTDKLFASMASQIAVSLLYDIGLHMSPPEEPSNVGLLLKRKGFGDFLQVRKERTMEDRRALLGTYVITSMTCHAFRSADGLNWSPYLDETLDYLAQNSIEPQDHVLIAQVKLQLIINQLRSTYRGSNSITPAPTAYLDALRLQVESLRSPSPANVVFIVFENNSDMMRLYHFTTIMIHESVMSQPSSSHDQDMKRFQTYQLVVNSIRSWLDLFFSISLDQLSFLPGGNFSQLYYIVVFIYKMTASKVPAWDALLAEAAVELMPTLSTVIQMFEQAEFTASSSRAPNEEADEAFLFGIQKFSALKMVWQSELGLEPDGQEESLPPLQDHVMMSLANADFTPFLLDPGMFGAIPGIDNSFQ